MMVRGSLSRMIDQFHAWTLQVTRDQLIHLQSKHNVQLLQCAKKGCTWSTDNSDALAQHAIWLILRLSDSHVLSLDVTRRTSLPGTSKHTYSLILSRSPSVVSTAAPSSATAVQGGNMRADTLGVLVVSRLSILMQSSGTRSRMQ